MPSQIDRQQLAELTRRGAQLIEVLPAEEYERAHLPEAVNLPLKELDQRREQLDRSRPVIAYCNDTL
jgi:rhodanese-related sulfurtransferase